MPCFHPVKAFLRSSGGISFTELARDQIIGDTKLPCGRCRGCRLDRARDWSLRIGHESKLHDQSYFVTLTYDEDHMPTNGSLTYSDVQKFFKAVRKALGPFRFFVVGEYGDQLQRPHYHAIMFGLELPDLVRFGLSQDGKSQTYTSARLAELWGRGFVLIGSVTPQSTGYVARYALKKITGEMADAHYTRVNADGEIVKLTPEFCHMSTRPGIGYAWYKKFHSDVHTHDYVVRDGNKMPVPRYYDKLFKRMGGELDVTKMGRFERAKPHAEHQTPARLAVREEVLAARTRTLKRTL